MRSLGMHLDCLSGSFKRVNQCMRAVVITAEANPHTQAV